MPRPSQKGSNNHNWRGGRTVHRKGYILKHAPDHPYAVNGYVMEHRLVAEQVLGTILPREVTVHHIDGDPRNNSPDNLVVFLTESGHQRFHHRISRRPRDEKGRFPPQSHQERATG